MTDSPKKAPALWKQLLGAVAGALVALGTYSVYTHGGDTVLGYLTPPGWRESAVPVPPTPREIHQAALADEQAYEMQRIASEAAVMAAQMQSSQGSGSGAMIAQAASSAASTWTSSAWASSMSSGRSQWRTGSRWSAGAADMARAETLPDSGLPLIGVIGAALGSTIVRRRWKFL